MAKKNTRKGSSVDNSHPSRRYNRRQFLRAASKASVVMTALGLSGVSLRADAQTAGLSNVEGARLELIQYAIRNADMEGAIKRYSANAKLDEKATSALRKLTKADLMSLRSIQEKLNLANAKIFIRY